MLEDGGQCESARAGVDHALRELTLRPGIRVDATVAVRIGRVGDGRQLAECVVVIFIGPRQRGAFLGLEGDAAHSAVRIVFGGRHITARVGFGGDEPRHLDLEAVVPHRPVIRRSQIAESRVRALRTEVRGNLADDGFRAETRIVLVGTDAFGRIREPVAIHINRCGGARAHAAAVAALARRRVRFQIRLINEGEHVSARQACFRQPVVAVPGVGRLERVGIGFAELADGAVGRVRHRQAGDRAARVGAFGDATVADVEGDFRHVPDGVVEDATHRGVTVVG